MTPDQIDKAIAEFCGWTEIQHYPESGRLWGNSPGSEGQFYRLNAVPQFHRCLNACHEAEKFAWQQAWHFRAVFVDHLARIINPAYGYRDQSGYDLLDATAIQRAEALLKTVGLWQEPQKLSTHHAV